MAIATEEEKRSALSFGRAGFVLPKPAASLVAGDKAQLLGLFWGITPTPPSTEVAPTCSTHADFAYTRGTAADFDYTKPTSADFAYTRGSTHDFVGRE